MKTLLKLEELGLLLLFSVIYFTYYLGSWVLFLSLFFVPDIAFVLFVISKKAGAAACNFMHHKGVMVVVILTGCYLQNEIIVKIGLIIMAHSCFDRVAGYGLKYFDSFDHTHLGWIGKSKHKNLKHHRLIVNHSNMKGRNIIWEITGAYFGKFCWVCLLP